MNAKERLRHLERIDSHFTAMCWGMLIGIAIGYMVGSFL